MDGPPTDLPVFIALFIAGHLEDFSEKRLLLGIIRVLDVPKETPECLKGRFLQFANIQTVLLDVLVLQMVRLGDHV